MKLKLIVWFITKEFSSKRFSNPLIDQSPNKFQFTVCRWHKLINILFNAEENRTFFKVISKKTTFQCCWKKKFFNWIPKIKLFWSKNVRGMGQLGILPSVPLAVRTLNWRWNKNRFYFFEIRFEKLDADGVDSFQFALNISDTYKLGAFLPDE